MKSMKTLLAPALAAVLMTAGCGSGEPDTLIIGTSGQMARYTQPAEGGGLEGFEIDVWNEIGRRLGKKVEYRTASLSGLWGMLDTGAISSIANPTTKTKARAEKYLFSEPYNYDPYVLVTRKGAGGGEGIASFAGKKVAVTAATNLTLVLDKWNEDHGHVIDVGYLDEQAMLLPAVANGTYDAAFMLRSGADIARRDLGMDIDIYNAKIPVLPAVYAFRKGEKGEKMQAEVRRVMEDMMADGTMQKLSEKWFGADLTKKRD